MKVLPENLVPGCLLLKDVQGKTIHPIVPKNTVVEPIHIKVLKDFEVPYVEVASRLVNGDTFQAPEVDPNTIKQEQNHSKMQKEPKEYTFFDYYVHAVKQTKHLFENWEEHPQLDLNKIRQIVAPFMQEVNLSIEMLLELHHYNDKHDYIYHHMVANSIISGFIAKKLNYDHSDCMQVALAAYLSDIGMIKEGAYFYKKDGVLTEAEYEKVQKHPIVSYRMLEHEPFLSRNIKLAVLQHHERLDGSGYPLGVKEDKLHSFARIIAVSDMYHAMTSERLYRKKQSPFKVIEEMMNEFLGKLDLKIIEALVQSIVYFSNGTRVRLTNNEIGEIVFVDERHPTRPMVKSESNDEIIQLVNHQDLYIEEIISS
ncbi:HD-GYP domain-containing protein [Piscibacillus salipiscarius]|uniref:HD-GYP domain-containing protein n=2 Tax=Piscibacillus salipiscarius TaxID=299480 RepID=A0ABW5Q9S4_9BACI